MKKIRYILLLFLAALNCLTVSAQWNPSNPAEPGEICMLVLKVTPEGTGTASYSGSVTVGSSVTLKATATTNYAFSSWKDATGKVVSTSSSYRVTLKEGRNEYTACFDYKGFNPSDPGEPNAPDPDPMRPSGYVICQSVPEGAGTISPASAAKVYLDTPQTFTVSPSSNLYSFRYWTDEDGNIVSNTNSLKVEVKNAGETLRYYAVFDDFGEISIPGNNPPEPMPVENTDIQLYAESVEAHIGQTVPYSFILTNPTTEAVKQLSFQILLSEHITFDKARAEIGERAQGTHKLTVTEQQRLDGTLYTMTVSGLTSSATISGTNGTIISIPLTVSKDAPDTYKGTTKLLPIYSAKVNTQYSTNKLITFRVGFVSIFDDGEGDINNDFNEDDLDAWDLMLYVVGYRPTIDLFKADFNKDGMIDMGDVVALQQYLLVKKSKK